MTWFTQLKAALPKYYNPQSTRIVGYLRGSDDPYVWASMERTRTSQMIILGNTPPTLKQWTDAGVAHRAADQKTIMESQLNVCIPGVAPRGFMVIGGSGTPRPWGNIVTIDDDAITYFPRHLESWKRNAR